MIKWLKKFRKENIKIKNLILNKINQDLDIESESFFVEKLKQIYHCIQDQFTFNSYFRSHKSNYEKNLIACSCIHGFDGLQQ